MLLKIAQLLELMTAIMKTLLIIVLTIIGTGNSLACKCEGPDSVEESFTYSDAAFLGKVINISFITFAELRKKPLIQYVSV